MKVLLINGSPNKDGCTYTALHEVETALRADGIDTELLYLGKKPLAGCIACGSCMRTGHCFRDDIVKDIQARLDEFDGIVIGSPVYYSGPSGQLVSFLNRLFYSSESRMAGKLGPRWCRAAGEERLPRLNSLTSILLYAICQLCLLNTGILCMASRPTM